MPETKNSTASQAPSNRSNDTNTAASELNISDEFPLTHLTVDQVRAMMLSHEPRNSFPFVSPNSIDRNTSTTLTRAPVPTTADPSYFMPSLEELSLVSSSRPSTAFAAGRTASSSRPRPSTATSLAAVDAKISTLPFYAPDADTDPVPPLATARAAPAPAALPPAPRFSGLVNPRPRSPAVRLRAQSSQSKGDVSASTSAAASASASPALAAAPTPAHLNTALASSSSSASLAPSARPPSSAALPRARRASLAAPPAPVPLCDQVGALLRATADRCRAIEAAPEGSSSAPTPSGALGAMLSAALAPECLHCGRDLTQPLRKATRKLVKDHAVVTRVVGTGCAYCEHSGIGAAAAQPVARRTRAPPAPPQPSAGPGSYDLSGHGFVDELQRRRAGTRTLTGGFGRHQGTCQALAVTVRQRYERDLSQLEKTTQEAVAAGEMRPGRAKLIVDKFVAKFAPATVKPARAAADGSKSATAAAGAKPRAAAPVAALTATRGMGRPITSSSRLDPIPRPQTYTARSRSLLLSLRSGAGTDQADEGTGPVSGSSVGIGGRTR